MHSILFRFWAVFPQEKVKHLIKIISMYKIAPYHGKVFCSVKLKHQVFIHNTREHICSMFIPFTKCHDILEYIYVKVLFITIFML